MSNTHYSLASLPVELLYTVFDYIPYPELLRVLHTCRSWRSVAKTCPAYWRDIDLELVDAATPEEIRARVLQLDLAEERLCCSDAPGLALQWSLCSWELADRAFQLLCDHWHRVKLLSLRVARDHGWLEKLLSQPAPLLEDLAIHCYPRFPLTHLTAVTCAALRTVSLGNVKHVQASTWVCESVTHVVLRNDSELYVPQWLFARFPGVQHLEVEAGRDQPLCLEPERAVFDPLPPKSLQTVELRGDDPENILDALSTAASGIQHISCGAMYTAHLAWDVAHSLAGDLSLRIVQDGAAAADSETVRLTYKTMSDHPERIRVRELALHAPRYRGIKRSNREFVDVGRVVRYIVSISDLHALLGLRELVACQHVVFEVPSDYALDITVRLVEQHSIASSLPALRRVTFEAIPPGGRVVGADIRRFLWLVGIGTEELELQLLKFEHVSGVSVLEQEFATVRLERTGASSVPVIRLAC